MEFTDESDSGDEIQFVMEALEFDLHIENMLDDDEDQVDPGSHFRIDNGSKGPAEAADTAPRPWTWETMWKLIEGIKESPAIPSNATLSTQPRDTNKPWGFKKLPAELRVMIWKEMLPTVFTGGFEGDRRDSWDPDHTAVYPAARIAVTVPGCTVLELCHESRLTAIEVSRKNVLAFVEKHADRATFKDVKNLYIWDITREELGQDSALTCYASGRVFQTAPKYGLHALISLPTLLSFHFPDASARGKHYADAEAVVASISDIWFKEDGALSNGIVTKKPFTIVA